MASAKRSRPVSDLPKLTAQDKAFVRDRVVPALINRAQATFDAWKNPVDTPSELFHYTSVDTAVRILKGRCLLATRAVSLPRQQELRPAVQFMKQILLERVKAAQTADLRFFYRQAATLLDPRKMPRDTRAEFDPYVVCFCADASSSHHHATYAAGGSGVAIGFRTGDILREPFCSLRMIYDLLDQRRLLTEVLDAYRDKALGWSMQAGDGAWKVMRVAAHLFSTMAWTLATSLKPIHFAPDREWRLAVFVLRAGEIDPSLLSPLRKGFVTTVHGDRLPYRALEFGSRDPVVSVTFGPQAAADSPARVEQALRAGGYALSLLP